MFCKSCDFSLSLLPFTTAAASIWDRVWLRLIRFYIATSKPRLDRPSTPSTSAEWFFAGFTRVTGTDTVEEERSEVYNVRSSSLLGLVLRDVGLTHWTAVYRSKDVELAEAHE
jgi:hypothetical protein